MFVLLITRLLFLKKGKSANLEEDKRVKEFRKELFRVLAPLPKTDFEAEVIAARLAQVWNSSSFRGLKLRVKEEILTGFFQVVLEANANSKEEVAV